jgi:polyisoprenoid-binding protein YceI
MNVRLVGSALTMLAGLTSLRPAAAAPEAYVVDPAHTSIIFSISHSALSFTYGMFRQAKGSYFYDRDNPANCRFQFEIQADSLDTNHAERDTHLRSNDSTVSHNYLRQYVLC